MDDTVVLTADPISAQFATDAVSRPAAGGISIFVGTTRESFEGKKVVRLEYEAYEPMALKEMRALCVAAREKWNDLISIAVLHRLGLVPVGEASVIIAVSSPHRAEAIGASQEIYFFPHTFHVPIADLTVPPIFLHNTEACHSIIDNLKAHVPIWKKEIYEDGSSWKVNREFTLPKDL